MSEREILNIDEAAELLGVSVKTFNKVLHAGNLPARKIGREWKFSRAALIAWVGSGRSRDFYSGSAERAEEHEEHVDEIVPVGRRQVQPGADGAAAAEPGRRAARRTAGWRIEHD